MYAPSFDYYRADSVADAHKLLQKHRGAKLLAGGHSLLPLLKMRLSSPPALIDIGHIADLKGVATAGDGVRIGALTTHAELASSAALMTACPILAEAAGLIGDQQVRNWGTIGGNVAHADPASDLPTVLVALDARFSIDGPKGRRQATAKEFFQGMMTTALGEHDILTAIEVPARQVGQGMAYVKLPHPASRYAVVGVAAVVTLKAGTCTAARIAVGGVLPAAARCERTESALAGQKPSAEAIAKAADQMASALSKDDVLEDVYASAEYRRAMAVVYARRALKAAVDRAA